MIVPAGQSRRSALNSGAARQRRPTGEVKISVLRRAGKGIAEKI
jgi:hypothetical protein